MDLKPTKAERIFLRSNPMFNEQWLEDLICEDPNILGLGDVEVIERQRSQESGGRLDLLLADKKEESRYEVELMLGSTDESHIIRCIEYWDVERRRYPAYNHCAVLVAEDITSRFLNILSLLSGHIPMIAIQFSVLKAGELIVPHFTRVLDQRLQRKDDIRVKPQATVTRADWEKDVSPQVLQAIDTLFSLLCSVGKGKYQLNYKEKYIGLIDGVKSRNFVLFSPLKKSLYLSVDIAIPSDWLQKLRDAKLECDVRGNSKGVWVTLDPTKGDHTQDLIKQLVVRAVKEYEG